MNDSVLLICITLIGGYFFVKGGATFFARLARATAVLILVGLLIAAWS
jgi:hypothetical protein